MPPTPLPIVLSDVYEIVLNGNMAPGGSNAKRSGNVFYYRRAVIGAGVTTAGLAAAFRTAVIVPLLAACNQRYSPQSVSIRMINDATFAPQTIAQAGVGAIATDGEPCDDAAVLMMKTAYRGKNGRGFKHFGGTNEVDTTDDILTGAGLARWQAVQAGCMLTITDAGGNQFAPFLFSRVGSQWKVNPTTIRGADFNSSKLIGNIGTMRRRRSKTVYV